MLHLRATLWLFFYKEIYGGYSSSIAAQPVKGLRLRRGGSTGVAEAGIIIAVSVELRASSGEKLLINN